MRFSLRWMLALTSYVALAAAALTRPSWYLVNVLWLAVVGAFAIAIVSTKTNKAASAGFIFAATMYIALLLIAPEIMPSARVGRQFMGGIEFLSQSRTEPAFRGAAHAIAVMVNGLMGAAIVAVAARLATVDAVKE